MIIRIKRLRELGIFSDFIWDTKVPAFGRYNLIYGSNGSGKTTLSKLFAGLESGSRPDYPSLEYEIETDTGTIKSGQPLPARIKVFNQEYVTNNVHFVSGRAKPILILGEENRKIAEQIAADEEQVATKQEHLAKLAEKKNEATKRRDRMFSEVAKTIGLNTAGLATRTYRKPDAERDFASLPSKMLLDDASVTAKVLDLKQQEQPNIDEVTVSSVPHDGGRMPLSDCLTQVNAQAVCLSSQTVDSRLVARLKENLDIATWVEQGLIVHRNHGSATCEFCEQQLPAERMAILAAHFNDADRALKADIDSLLRRVAQAEHMIAALRMPDKANLYDELRAEYQGAADTVNMAQVALLRDIGAFRQAIEDKRGRTTESLELNSRVDATTLLAGIEAANAAIRRHNAKTVAFKAVKVAAQKALEAHYLSLIYDDAKNLDQQIETTQARVATVLNGDPTIPGDAAIADLESRITSNRAKISSSHKGCQELNTKLRTFLGRDELRFEVEGDGYVLKRGKTIAHGLSEGERTAIGVVHFIINLGEQGFDPVDGIIVVDDPVSSLDSNSIFQAFAFLKTAVKDAKQVFFLTHDFDFLRLLLNWVKYSRTSQPGYHMITDAYDLAGRRSASIGALDRLLRDHESEYHYLFKRLRRFEADGTIESVYDVPNVARKVLESFLMFRVPNNQNLYQKIESLKGHFDENKLASIYKFTNDQSHMTGKGFDPSLVAETKKNVKYLLEMIDAVFPEHYEILLKSIGTP